MKKIIQNKKKISPKIFIFVNIIILILISTYYGYRFVYYYKIEHPKQIEEVELGKLIISKNSMATTGDGLYKKNDLYYFKGKSFNNYVWYSGRLWQVVSVNKNNEIKLVEKDAETSIAWGGNNEYEDSYIYNYLNKTEEDFSGVFYDSLSNPSSYLIKSPWCSDTVLDEFDVCEKETNAYVGLLSISEYNLSNGQDGYLYNGQYWWTINKSSDNKVWYVYDGGLDDNSYQGNTSYSFGVRPSIVLNNNVVAVSGDGSIGDPYIIESSTAKTINEIKIGEYVTFDDYNWRVLSQSDSCTKLVMNGFVQESNTDKEIFFSSNSKKYTDQTKIGYYLNNTFYNSLKDKEKLVKTTYETGSYGGAYNFNYTSIYGNSASAYVGLLAVGQLFSSDYEDYYLMTGTSSSLQTVYIAIENSKIYADTITTNAKVRPVICVYNVDVSSGNGTKNNPYITE